MDRRRQVVVREAEDMCEMHALNMKDLRVQIENSRLKSGVTVQTEHAQAAKLGVALREVSDYAIALSAFLNRRNFFVEKITRQVLLSRGHLSDIERGLDDKQQQHMNQRELATKWFSSALKTETVLHNLSLYASALTKMTVSLARPLSCSVCGRAMVLPGYVLACQHQCCSGCLADAQCAHCYMREDLCFPGIVGKLLQSVEELASVSRKLKREHA
eukprot:218688_1